MYNEHLGFSLLRCSSGCPPVAVAALALVADCSSAATFISKLMMLVQVLLLLLLLLLLPPPFNCCLCCGCSSCNYGLRSAADAADHIATAVTDAILASDATAAAAAHFDVTTDGMLVTTHLFCCLPDHNAAVVTVPALILAIALLLLLLPML